MLKNQRVWAEVDLDRIAHNTRIIKEISQKAELMAIVKADGYGHGALEVSKAMLFSGAESLGVAILEEGIDLRKNNICEPILILGYTPENKLSQTINYDLIQTVFHKEMAKKLSEEAVRLHKLSQIHIKLDTGMGRLGFLPSEKSIDEIMEISKLPNIKLTGIYTHLADSDSKEREFTETQYKIFKDFTDALYERGLKGLKRHISNSGGIAQYPHMGMDMVRSGILLYGIAPSFDVNVKELGLLPAMSFKTKVSYIKELEEGVSISYSRTYFTSRKTTVATVPVGYADGYSRLLSNKAKVIINGAYAPVIGNICMDQFMIDVTDIDGVTEGTEIVLMGEEKGLEITAEDIARIEGKISYEVLCCIGKRVPRIYKKNGREIKMVNL